MSFSLFIVGIQDIILASPGECTWIWKSPEKPNFLSFFPSFCLYVLLTSCFISWLSFCPLLHFNNYKHFFVFAFQSDSNWSGGFSHSVILLKHFFLCSSFLFSFLLRMSKRSHKFTVTVRRKYKMIFLSFVLLLMEHFIENVRNRIIVSNHWPFNSSFNSSVPNNYFLPLNYSRNSQTNR